MIKLEDKTFKLPKLSEAERRELIKENQRVKISEDIKYNRRQKIIRERK